MKIIFTNPEGEMSFLIPSATYLATFESQDAGLQTLIQKDVPEDCRSSAKIVEDDTLPVNRKFRDAWEQDDEAIAVDMGKARSIHMSRIREVRNSELAKEDINFQKAIETDDPSAKTAVVTKKQILRDIPQTFDLSGANTGDELDAMWPSELPARTDD
jgi:hypothetical protein